MEYNTVINSKFEDVDFQVEKIKELIKTNERKPSELFICIIDFVVRELLNNAIEHGNKFDKEKKIKFTLDLEYDKLELIVIDEGDGFVLDEILEKQKTDDVLKTRNRGLLTIKDIGFNIVVEKSKVKANIILGEKYFK
jgi:anti-sigma regulatory factor (Ser/Thr protein kinase)